MSVIVFGSPEAAAILAKDKELKRREEKEAEENTLEWIDNRIGELESEIDAMRSEVNSLEYELDMLEIKRKKLAKS